MKSIQSKNSTAANHNHSPFFQKESGNSSFVKNEKPFFNASPIQAKLTVNQPNDPYEKEADAMAGKVVQRLNNKSFPNSENNQAAFFRKSGNPIQRQCAACGKKEKVQKKEQEDENDLQKSSLQRKPIFESDAQPPEDENIRRKCAACEKEDKLQKKPESSLQTASPHIEKSLNSSKGSGSPLPHNTREEMESSFGADFSGVRIHNDTSSVQMNKDLNAQAFTHGSDIYFNSDKYNTTSKEGQQLLAHELTHVVQQSSPHENVVRRDLIDDLRAAAEARVTAQLTDLANKPVVTHSGFTGGATCHPNFCQPFANVPEAITDLIWAGPLILAGIATKVNPRVVPLWATYMRGGSAPQNLSSNFGSDFTASPTTAKTTKFLITEMQNDIKANQAAIMGGQAVAFVDFNPRLSSAVAAIDDPNDRIHRMNFTVIGDIAGNIAGGIGKDETLFPIGATPSPFNDAREVSITALLTLNSDGSITVLPFINFTVKDTIDLCPGDCGAAREQIATVPLSRFEATGLSGDVPIIIQFTAPAAELTPFVIPAPAAPGPQPGTVTASALNIRGAANTSSPVVGSYTNGESIMVICQIKGTLVDGNDLWYKTDRGFVSARYVTISGTTMPAAC